MSEATTFKTAAAVMSISFYLAALPVALAQSYIDISTLPSGLPFRWSPTRLTMSNDGSLFVATAHDQVFAFDPQGRYLSSFDLPTFGDLTGFAVDGAGTLHVSWNGRIEGYDSSGTHVYRNTELSSIRSIAVGPNDKLYVASEQTLGAIGSGSELTVLASNSFGGWQDIAFGPDGQIYAYANRSEANRNDPVIQSFDSSGALLSEFAISKQNNDGGTGDFSGLAVSADAVYVSHDRSGAVQKYAKTGSLIGVGYGTPRNNDLLATSSGDLLAAAPHARIVDTIGPERFASDYAGVTQFFDRPNSITRFGTPLFPEQQVNLEHGWSETTGETFLVPGAPGEMVDLTFHRVNPNNSVISVYPIEAINANPIADPAEYLRQAFDAAYTHLIATQVPSNQSVIDTITVEAGTEIGFLYQRNQWRTLTKRVNWANRPEFNGQSIAQANAAFQELSEMSDDELAEYLTRAYDDPISSLDFLNPMSSDPRANWGRMDQFAFFLGENATFMAMEDLQISGFSDLSFHDATLWIDARLIPVPEPGTILLSTCALFLCTSWECKRRSRDGQ